MKKLYLFMLCLVTATLGALAQTGEKYYLDIAQDNTRYYFEWDADAGCYVLEIPELWGDFKIYDDRYVEGGNNQNQYIFGASDVGQGAGVTPDIDKKLANPGQNMSIEGGGILYEVRLEFNPTTMELKIVGGSHTPPAPTKPTIRIEATRNDATSPESGEIDFKISTVLIDNPETLSYDVYAIYTSPEASGYLDKEIHITGKLTGTFKLDGLKIDTNTPVWLVVRTTLDDGTQLVAHTETSITTPPIPYLVGQILNNVWKPENAILGKRFENERTPECYYWTVTLVDNGEFSFVSKPGSWDTVNAHPRYAPSEKRESAPLTQWVPYTRFSGSTENAWVPEPFEPGAVYTIQFSFPKNSVTVVKSNHPTGIEAIDADITDRPVDVYNMQGILLRHDVAPDRATTDLPAGLYIVGNKKVLVH
ncbi:MAG: hypothetical protein K1V84_06300 [Muribaculaceae bacterium]